jgi:putative tricarboxylic transport membrane protein
MTPVAMMALDEFVLWVNADTPIQDGQDYVAAIKAAPAASSRWAAPGRSRRTRSSPWRMEKAIGAKMTYVPYKGGGEVAVQLVGKHVDSTRQQPDRRRWRNGAPASSARSAFRQQAPAVDRQDRRRHVVGRHPDLQVARASDIEYLMLRGVSCRRASRRRRSIIMSTC